MPVNNDFYCKTEFGSMHTYWSSNPPAEPETATAVIAYELYDLKGNWFDGGELDIQGDVLDLKLYVKDCLDLADLPGPYEELTEDDFYEAVNDEP